LAVYRQATALMPALLGDTQSLIATGEVTGWSGLLPAVVVVLIVGLLGVGVRPRLAEYRR
jgi:prepilin signal peptidase PulO-like enzyme (type II secretory pathway)